MGELYLLIYVVYKLEGAFLGCATMLEAKAYPLGLIANAQEKASKCVGLVSDVSEWIIIFKEVLTKVIFT